MINNKGDDTFFDRLFSYFQSQFKEKIIQFYPIRSLVFLVETEKNTYVLKGYRTNRRLRLQETFSTTLKKEGFINTYTFVSPPLKDQLFFEGFYFGCTRYIPPNKIPFSFQTKENREEGLGLLEYFHRVTAKFEKRYRSLIPLANLEKKWRDRRTVFLNNLPFLNYFVNGSFFSEMVSWADWALDGMEKNHAYFLKEPFVILHGDVAHHNFLRDSNGKLRLIDFDLISIGPEVNDFLQFANRILPYLDWSIDKLEATRPFHRYLKDEAFLYGLAFPADIFREWNRIVREKAYTNPAKVKQVMDLSIGQFFERKKFIEILMKKV